MSTELFKCEEKLREIRYVNNFININFFHFYIVFTRHKVSAELSDHKNSVALTRYFETGVYVAEAKPAPVTQVGKITLIRTEGLYQH